MPTYVQTSANMLSAPDVVYSDANMLQDAYLAIDRPLTAKPMLAGFDYGHDSLGNLHAQLKAHFAATRTIP